VRSDLGKKIYEQENGWFRDAKNRLSSVRDAEAMIETFDTLAERYTSVSACAPLRSLREALEERRIQVAEHSADLEEIARSTTESLLEQGLPGIPGEGVTPEPGVGNVPCDARGIDTEASHVDRLGVDIGSEDLNVQALVLSLLLLVQQHRDRIGLLTGRAPGDPDSDRLLALLGE